MPLKLTSVAKELRKRSTEAERVLWRQLRMKKMAGYKFRRQEQIGRFIVDFVCYEQHLVIEADGGQHAVERQKDMERTFWLEAQGFRVLRFWNHEILSNTVGVMEVIRRHCPPLPPAPSHSGEGEPS